MADEKAPPADGAKKPLTLNEDDLVVNRKVRSGSFGRVGANVAGATKVVDPGAKRGQAGDPDA
jgi:hypothetical protein